MLQTRGEYNKTVGAYGEKLAEQFLIKRGYKILARNIKTGYKELDIVSREVDILVFVEVKTRTNLDFGAADEAMSRKKLQFLKRAISYYLRFVNKEKYRDLRVDFIAVDINKITKRARIQHYKDIIA